VDDEEINLELFKLSFRNYFEIVTAKSAKDGLRILREQQIPLVVTDYKMPEMDGIKFIEEIKSENPDIICLIVTGFVDVVISGKEELIFDMILKPWKKDDVRNKIFAGLEAFYKFDLRKV
jgi:YesN/AraC family two-component response regulator